MTKLPPETDQVEFKIGGSQQNELFSVLSHQYRRFTLQHLQTVDTPLSVDELTTELMAWDGQRITADQSDDDRDAIAISLVHSHLPQMAEAGVIEYNASQQTVTLSDRADEIQTHLSEHNL